MAFTEHPLFSLPQNKTKKIWRYVSPTKFLSLLNSRTLHFARADKMREIDPYEGRFSHVNAQIFNLKYSSYPADFWNSRNIKSEEEFNSFIQAQRMLHQFQRSYASELVFINCWHMSDYESDAMWKVYAGSGDGICIQSTIAKAIEATAHYEDPIFMGKVDYKNYLLDAIKEGDTFSPFLSKRLSFQHEKEFRFITWKPQDTDYEYLKSDGSSGTKENHASARAINKYPARHGISVPVQLTTLIEGIYVSPTSPIWFAELIKDLVKKYEFDLPVYQSEMALPPHRA